MVNFDVLPRNSILLGEDVNNELGPVGGELGVDLLVTSTGVGGTCNLKLGIRAELGSESVEVSKLVLVEGVLCKVEEENDLLLALSLDDDRFWFEVLGSLKLIHETLLVSLEGVDLGLESLVVSLGERKHDRLRSN